jgi:hypothetical protein
MFFAERSEQRKTSPLPGAAPSPVTSKAPYSPSGRRKQFVWPYIVSGRRVAATKKTRRPAARREARGARRAAAWCSAGTPWRRILTSVYSCGVTPSPEARSWSAQACPSMGEKIVGRLPKPIFSAARRRVNCQRMKAS